MDHENDKGLIKLINQKIDSGHTLDEIRRLLDSAGISKNQIERALLRVHPRSIKANTANHYQREIEDNDFLPPLKKKHNTHTYNSDKALDEETDLYGSTEIYKGGLSRHSNLRDSKVYQVLNEPIEQKVEEVISEEIRHRGLFKGRLRRKEFIIGFLFFFGLGFLFFTAVVYLLQIMSPSVWKDISNFVEWDMNGVWYIFMPFIFAPITVIMTSLITRRLHNLELPGFISWFYLLIFITPPKGMIGYTLIAMDIALFVLFIVLITKRGHPAPNKHGALPSSHGSMFAKIMGRH